MARYILKKDGKLYNKDTGEPRKQTNRRGVMYYDVWVDGKTRAIQIDPWLIMKEYNLSEYNIEIEDGIVEDEMFIQHLNLRHKYLTRFHSDDNEIRKRLWRREVVRYGKEYLFKK